MRWGRVRGYKEGVGMVLVGSKWEKLEQGPRIG